MKKQAISHPKLPQRMSLVAQTVESLCEGIQNGHWTDNLPGERELCAALQVSRRTLRVALEDLQRRGWLEVCGRQRRRISARNVSKEKVVMKKVIGVLMPGSFLSMPSRISFVMETLREKLTAAGCVVQFHIQPACFRPNPSRALERFVSEHPAKVWIVLSAQEPMQRWFDKAGVSCLILGSCAPGIRLSSVDVDFHAACHHAGGLLWRRGHRRIALVLRKGIYGGDIASEEGLREAMKEMPGTSLQVLRHDATAAHLCALVDECLRTPQPPTAYLVAGAMHVVTVMMHLTRRGKSIPKDVAVISRDNDTILEATSPAVAHYAVEAAQMASRIVHVVRQLAETGSAAMSTVRLMPTFVAGETV